MVPNFNAMFRSLIPESPIAPTFNPASQQARRYLEQGGAAGARAKEKRGEIAELAVPPDIDAALLADAIEAKLGALAGPVFGPRIRMPRLLVRASGGRMLVRGDVLRRLGDGDVERGRRFLERVVRGFRSQSRR
jgi:hypothetical protein